MVKEAQAKYLTNLKEEHRSLEKGACPDGYKLTEVGEIPQNWSVKRIGDITSISIGGDVDDSHFSLEADETYCYPIYSNTVDNPGIYGFYDYQEYTNDSLTVVGRGIGLGTAIKRNGGFGAIGRLIVLSPKLGSDNGFIENYINHKIDVFSESSGVPQLTGVAISNYKIAFPPFHEQCIISKALSDIDALISSLEKLIAKKQAIKTATMQQLLTGKKRLPGFGEGKGYKQTELGEIPEDWNASNLEDLAIIIMGQSPSGDSYNKDGYGVALINGPTEFTKKTPIKKQWTPEPTKFCENNDLLLCVRGSSTGRMNIANDKYCIGRGVAAIRAKSESDTNYLKFQVYSAIQSLLSLSTGSTFPSVDGKAIKSILIPRPILEEQIVIALALSDMDEEIETIEKRLNKTQQIKQGMMQELLTGKTRLVNVKDGVTI